MTLRYYKELGGVKPRWSAATSKRPPSSTTSHRRIAYVLWAVDRPADRSIMNVTFGMTPEYADLEGEFIDFCAQRGMVGIKGHRSVGGFRASLYNALPIESVEELIDCMHDFRKLK